MYLYPLFAKGSKPDKCMHVRKMYCTIDDSDKGSDIEHMNPHGKS